MNTLLKKLQLNMKISRINNEIMSSERRTYEPSTPNIATWGASVPKQRVLPGYESDRVWHLRNALNSLHREKAELSKR